MLAMSHKSIGNIDTGDVPEDEDMNILCLNLGQKHIELVCGQVQMAEGLESFGMMGNWGLILPWGSGMKVCPGNHTNGCNGALDAFDAGAIGIN